MSGSHLALMQGVAVGPGVPVPGLRLGHTALQVRTLSPWLGSPRPTPQGVSLTPKCRPWF